MRTKWAQITCFRYLTILTAPVARGIHTIHISERTLLGQTTSFLAPGRRTSEAGFAAVVDQSVLIPPVVPCSLDGVPELRPLRGHLVKVRIREVETDIEDQYDRHDDDQHCHSELPETIPERHYATRLRQILSSGDGDLGVRIVHDVAVLVLDLHHSVRLVQHAADPPEHPVLLNVRISTMTTVGCSQCDGDGDRDGEQDDNKPWFHDDLRVGGRAWALRIVLSCRACLGAVGGLY